MTAVYAVTLGSSIGSPISFSVTVRWAVVVGLIVWSIAMFIGDRVGKQNRGEDSITVRDGVILGTLQSLALVPGVSRSGATITGGLLLGLDRVAATRMSFFLGIPTLIASGLYQAVKEAKHIADGVGWGSTLLGTAVSGVVAYVSIAWLLRYVSKNDFTGFIIYRIALALVIVVLLVTQVISAT